MLKTICLCCRWVQSSQVGILRMQSIWTRSCGVFWRTELVYPMLWSLLRHEHVLVVLIVQLDFIVTVHLLHLVTTSNLPCHDPLVWIIPHHLEFIFWPLVTLYHINLILIDALASDSIAKDIWPTQIIRVLHTVTTLYTHHYVVLTIEPWWAYTLRRQ